jgi:hypothetical protein
VNVTCEQCQKKYVIPDERVAGKPSVSIRCKMCSHQTTVKVTGPMPMSSTSSISAPPPPPRPPKVDEEWSEEGTRAMPAFDTSVQWFAMIGGKQEGPFGVGQLQEKVTEGAVGLRTYLWNSEMEGWKRACDVSEVSPIFAGVNVSAEAHSELDQPKLTDFRPAVSAPRASTQSIAPTSVEDKKVSSPTPSQSLGDLFSDVGEPSGENQTEVTAPGPVDGDPFEKLSEGGPVKSAAPGEATKFFIAQAGVNKRNPPWKIALFGALFIAVPIGVVSLLNTFQIVTLPTVSHTNADGVEVQDQFFSSEGISGFADILSGEKAKKDKAVAQKRAEVAAALEVKKKADAVVAAGIGSAVGASIAVNQPATNRGNGTGRVEGLPADALKGGKTAADLAALYGEETGIKSKGPKIRKDENAPVAEAGGEGLSRDVSNKVMADKSKAFQGCIDNATRRNPNLRAGTVLLVLDIAQTGVVKSAFVMPKKHEGTDYGDCFTSIAKRIVFPAADRDTQLEIPYKVGAAIAP